MSELKDACVEPVQGPIVTPEEADVSKIPVWYDGPEPMTQARVGQKAPDFEASAFVAGEGFKPLKLSDYKGQWIALCFYPGDFTFV